MRVDWFSKHHETFWKSKLYLMDLHKTREYCHFPFSSMWEKVFDIQVHYNESNGHSVLEFKTPEHFTAFLLEWK